MNIIKTYLNYLNECDCEASEYNEIVNGDEPKDVDATAKDIEDELMQEAKKWIQKAIEKPGSLHRALGVPSGEKIPAEKLKVKPGDTAKMKKRKILAKTLKGLKHTGPKK